MDLHIIEGNLTKNICVINLNERDAKKRRNIASRHYYYGAETRSSR